MQTNVTNRGRRRLPLILGGCAVLGVFALLCVVGAIAVNAAYWTVQYNEGNVGPGSYTDSTELPTMEELLAEVEALPTGDATAGEDLFNGAAACQACHSLEPDVKVVGPSLAGVGDAAAIRRPDYSAAMYLYEAIAYPNAHVVDGFQPNTMPGNFKTRLTPQELADLIAFLLTQ